VSAHGCARLFWRLLAGMLRLYVAVGGWLALRAIGSPATLFLALSAALVVYGATLSTAVASGA
jgi:hypothetical protein